MKFKDNIRLYTWLEFLIWFIILCLCVFAIRVHRYEKAKALPSYQIFMPDVDGMIVGSPVKYMGVQVGYIKNLKILTDRVYVRFVITEKDVTLPKGVVATVEFSGLGGSKSLELYPPTENSSDRIVIVQAPKRLNNSISLINDMFLKIDSIGTRFTHFGDEMGVINGGKMKIMPDNIGKNMNEANSFVENILNRREMFKNKWKGNKDE